MILRIGISSQVMRDPAFVLNGLMVRDNTYPAMDDIDRF